MRHFLFISFALRFLGLGRIKSQSNARLSLLGSAFGIGISIIPLVVVLFVSDGMVQGIAERTVELGTGQIAIVDIHPSASFLNCEHELELKKILKEKIKDDYLTSLFVQREGHGILVGKNSRKGGIVRAVEPAFFTENKHATSLLKIISGKAMFSSSQSIILGQKISEKLNLNVGDVCRLITLRENKIGKRIPKVTTFKVEGIISSGYQELDALWMFIPLEKGLEVLSSISSQDYLIVSTKNPFDAVRFESFLNVIENELILARDIPKTFNIYTWKDLNRALFYSFSTTKNLILFIAFLITLVASINISQALIMLNMERRGEIAILKATGASPSFITSCFLTAGFITSFLGLLIGIPIGILISININTIFKIFETLINYTLYYFAFLQGELEGYSLIHLLDPTYYLEEIPINIRFSELYFIAVIALFLSFIVSLIPSIKAGREKPLSIMRKL